MDDSSDDDDIDFCYNCQRRHVNLTDRPWSEISRMTQKTYFHVTLRHVSVDLCSSCNRYLQKGSTQGHWPAMVWAFLSSNNSNTSMLATPSSQEKWKYIPYNWRGWWIQAMQHTGVTMSDPPTKVADVTSDRNELKAALSSLLWKKMAPAMDKYLAFPSVRCPWGCGAYLHENNEIPYEDLLLFKSNYSFRSTSSCNYRHQHRKWTDSSRPDFPSSTTILDNDNFVCRPSIIVKEDGPFLLCCKKHDRTTVDRVVHVPTNPTGSLFTESSNQYAPVVLKSRTLRKVKLNQYSDTYKTVELQGGYDGVDSAYCCSVGNRRIANHLSRSRDYLSLKGRQDVRHHFEMLCESIDSATYLPHANIKEMLDQADQQHPNISNTFQHNLAGSTYVSVEHAILMQESAYDEQPITILLGECQEADIFQPPWPANMIRVHPFDSHGERFTAITAPIAESNAQGFHLWSIMCCLLCVDEIWNIASRSMRTDNDIFGYLMTLAWLQRRQDTSRSGSQRCYKFFNLKDIPNQNDNDDSSGSQHENSIIDSCHRLLDRLNATDPTEPLTWPAIPGDERIASFQSTWDPNVATDVCDYVIVTFSKYQSTSYQEQSNGSHNFSFEGINDQPIGEDWQSVLIISKAETPTTRKANQWNGSICCRHGGHKHIGWWKQEQLGKRFLRCKLKENLLFDGVRLIVFRKTKHSYTTHMRDRYLKYLGGQSAVFCACHKSPLILSYKDDRKCCCNGNDIASSGCEWVAISYEHCKRDGKYVCPHLGCNTAICETDFSTLCDRIGKSCYLLSPSFCKRASYDGAIVVPDHHECNEDSDNNDDNLHDTHDGIFHNHAFEPDWDNEHEDDKSAATQDNNIDPNDFGPGDSYEIMAELLEDESEEEDNIVDNNDANHDTGPLHPMSMAHNEEPLTVELDMESEETKEVLSIPLHVFLNRQGHCLIRRNAKLRPARRQKSFLQRLVARSKDKCVPLLYGEGTLFPDIFFFSAEEGAVLGALPTAFWTDKHTLSRHGIASMRQHALIRVNDPALLTCTDNRYHFLTMDTLVNLGLRGNDSRLLLHRGFAERQDKNEGVAIRTEEGTEELYDDNVDNHSNVHKLSRLCEEDAGHYFYTQSCNSSTARALGILRKWVMSSEALEKVMTKHGVTREEADQILRGSAAPYVQSTWNVFIDLWMNYIINSPERPLGRIDWAWIRKEFQDKTGNVSHIHAILKTFFDISTKEGRQQILDKIRGALADLIRYDEIQNLVNLGIMESKECLVETLELAIKFLTHRCGPRCQIVKKDENGNDVFICKRPYNWLLSSNPGVHTMEQVIVSHTASALDILKEIGFANDHLEDGRIQVTHPQLQMTRHVPKCSKSDNKFSPTNGTLFTMYPSASNLQYVSGHCLSAYLSSYIAEVDRVAIVHMKPPNAAEPNKIRGEYDALNNTKIKSVKKHHDVRLAGKRGKVPVGRPVTQMEALTVINAEPLVRSTREFIHLPTCPRELRAAAPAPYLKNSCRPQDLQAILAVTGQTARQRKRFPAQRMFTQHQLLVIQDELRAPLKTDRVTHFSMRPPELRFVDNCVDYIRWFERESVCPLFNPTKALDYMNTTLNIDENNSSWMDGFNYKITVHCAALRPLYEHAKERLRNDACVTSRRNPRLPSPSIIRLLSKLVWMFEGYQSSTSHVYTRRTNDEYKSLSAIFISKNRARKLPVVWWTPIHPRRNTAFLVQILLCMGHFNTEYELMLQGNIRGSFIEAGLLDTRHPTHSLHEILRSYVLRHLRVQAGSTFQFDRNLTDAYNLLQEVIFPTITPSPLHCTSAVLYSSIVRDTNQKVTNHLDECRKNYITALYGEIQNCGLIHLVPAIEAMIAARVTPIAYDEIKKFFPPPLHPNQSIASHTEQSAIMMEVEKAVSVYKSGWQRHRNFVFVGGPGVGKTTVATFCSLYCLAMGLNGIVTSLVADRSKALGGIHFHRLIALKGLADSTSPGRAAELALQAIYRHPEMLEFIRRLDFINLDELGPFSAEYFGILDIVTRYIRGVSTFMGGLFIFCTMDHLQLLPFRGTPVLLSLYVVTDFTFYRLTESVRASKDPALREIIGLTRTINWNSEKKQRLAHLLREHLVFVDSFDDPAIPADAIYVFGRKEPCRAAEKIMIDRMKLVFAGLFRIFRCHDEESTTGGNWHAASEGTSRRLDKKVKSRRELVFYPNAKFEFTQVLKGKFNQGQLALMLHVPSDDILANRKPVKVFAAPSGVKNYPPPTNCNATWLLEHNWYEVSVPHKTTANEQIVKGIQARRTQYPLKPRVSSTIHACMGSTLSSIVSAVVSLTGMPYNFSLWEAAQVVVLLSRTSSASNIYFVGDKEATIKHIIDVLSGQQYRYLRFISSLLDKLCGESIDRIELLPQPTRFQPRDAELPRCPGVYLIVSTKKPLFEYIGETNNLARRIEQHNSLQGPQTTAQPDLLPFAMHAYVIGFSDKTERLQFEAEWKLNNQRRQNISLNNNGRVDVGLDMIREKNTERHRHDIPPLRLIACGQIIIQNLSDQD